MYIAGDINVVELVTLLREELVCSHASQLIFSSSDVLNDFEQLLWLTSWKWSERTDDWSYLLFKMVTVFADLGKNLLRRLQILEKSAQPWSRSPFCPSHR